MLFVTWPCFSDPSSPSGGFACPRVFDFDALTVKAKRQVQGSNECLRRLPSAGDPERRQSHQGMESS